jgi:hypothetical protein
MKCRYCGAKGVKITHFMQKHKALMLRKMKRGRHGKRGVHIRTKSGKSEKIVHTTTGGHDKLKLTFYD